MARILVVEDDELNRNLIKRILELENHEILAVRTAEEGIERALEKTPDLMMLDVGLPGMSGIEATRKLRTYPEFAETPIVVVSAFAMQAEIDEALEAGANEYLTKPVNLDELTTLLHRALADRPKLEEASALEATRKELFSEQALLGNHPKLNQVREFVRRVAEIPNPTVLLLGESGTGKNLVAQAIHYSSPHTAGRFVEINCSALPGPLLEGRPGCPRR